MLTPHDKVSRRGNDIIQIVVTRVCDIHTCSNCTQLLPHRVDPQHMSLECAELALKSVEGWPGVTAMFGGNPVTHPQFVELCELWRKYVPNQRQRGLWTNHLMTDEKGKAAQETFYPHGRFNLNVHESEKAAQMMQRWLPGVKIWGRRPSHHGMLLGDHKDLGVSEADWVAAREKCDINQKWSSGVYARDVTCEHCDGTGTHRTEPWSCSFCNSKGTVQRPFTYFCEVAGSIDGVTGENNGLPAEVGWWKRPISDFDHQIKGCCDKYCVVPLRLKGHTDNERVYDITPSVVHLTAKPKGPVTTEVHETVHATIKETTDYQKLRS